MTHGSLFSGIGGFDLAAEWAGFENLFHCEINTFCREFLNKRFGGIDYEDITKTDFSVWRGLVDVLSGGFPCQDASIAKQIGKGQTGLEGERTGLWWHMARGIEEIRPKFVVAENVGNILRTNDGRDFAKIIHCLAGMGYHAEWKAVYASDVGAPHRRKRCYLVAYARDLGLPEGKSIFADVHPAIQPECRLLAGTSAQIRTSWSAEPSICCVDYGFSQKSLTMYGKSRLKEEVFKAYGNAVVPQIPYAIFKAIESCFQNGNNLL